MLDDLLTRLFNRLRRAASSARVPDYAHLLTAQDVLHRADIYGSGPPNPVAPRSVVAIAERLPAPVLDFGCGSGALVRALQERRVEARGIEVDRPGIREALKDDVRDRVMLYDGRFPLPFGDGEFRSACAFEVIEHVEDYETAVAELFRVARDTVVVSVPDATAIPRLHHAGVVPWHLLEATHVNFFTPNSLRRVLERHCRDITIDYMGPVVTNGLLWHNSIVAACRKT